MNMNIPKTNRQASTIDDTAETTLTNTMNSNLKSNKSTNKTTTTENLRSKTYTITNEIPQMNGINKRPSQHPAMQTPQISFFFLTKPAPTQIPPLPPPTLLPT